MMFANIHPPFPARDHAPDRSRMGVPLRLGHEV